MVQNTSITSYKSGTTLCLTYVKLCSPTFRIDDIFPLHCWWNTATPITQSDYNSQFLLIVSLLSSPISTIGERVGIETIVVCRIVSYRPYVLITLCNAASLLLAPGLVKFAAGHQSVRFPFNWLISADHFDKWCNTSCTLPITPYATLSTSRVVCRPCSAWVR